MAFFKRALCAAAVTALLASNAVAEVAPLPAGKPAGTREAALIGFPVLLLGLAAVAAVIAVAVSSDNHNSPTTPTTGTGS